MKLNRIFLLAGLLAAAAFLGGRPAGRKAEKPQRPNVVFIVVDDMNKFSILHNYPALKTPAIDKLAAESYNFIHATCAVPLCAPSRAAFFSGVAPAKTGVYRNYRDIYDSSVLSHTELLPEYFKRNGYLTWGRGKTFHMKVNDGRENKMFDNSPVIHGGYGPYADKAFWYGNSGWASIKPWTGPDSDFPDVTNADAAISFLQQQHDRPFFLYYGLFRPHTPYTAPKRFYDLYKDEDITLPPGYQEGDLEDVPLMGRALVDSMKQYHKRGLTKKQVWLRMMKGYCANTSFADWNVGRVVEALDKSEYAKNTILVFCADNGFHCGTKDHWTKKTLWEQADMVPLLIRLPGGRAVKCSQTVSLLDIFPTLMEYCHLSPPSHPLDGRSLVPIFKNPDVAWNRPAFTTWGPQYASVRGERYRYIRYPDGNEELYDHRNDPYEHANLASEPGMKPVMSRLAKQIPAHFTKMIPPAKPKASQKKKKQKGADRLKKEGKAPNIVVILADDLGWGDVGFHGSDIQTPNIDRLAKEGIVLDRFYTCPICSPTRAGLMTGRYPNRLGLRNDVIPPWSSFGVDTSEVFLPQLLAKAGYTHRAALGKWHLGHAFRKYLPLQRGFTHFYGFYNGAIDYFTHKREGELDWHNDTATCYDKGYSTDLITKEAVRCIKAYAGQAPFFLYVAYNAPHGPLQAKKEDLLRYGFDENKPLFSDKGGPGSTGRGNTRRQTYSAMVTCMDRGIGKILRSLKDLHIEDNTVVLFFSDNGAAPHGGGSSGILRGTKFQEWEGGVRAPAIIRWPAGLEEPGISSRVTGYIDVLPTLLAAAGVNSRPPKPLDGINMLPALEGEKEAEGRYFYLGRGALIHAPWKLVKAHAGNPRMKITEDQLFNIMRDPSEKTNVKENHPGLYNQLKETVRPFDSIRPQRHVPPYGKGRKGFTAPENWKILQ